MEGFISWILLEKGFISMTRVLKWSFTYNRVSSSWRDPVWLSSASAFRLSVCVVCLPPPPPPPHHLMPVFCRIPWHFAGTAAASAVGTGLLMYDVHRKRVYKDQKFSDAWRHYMSVNSLAWLGYVFQVGLAWLHFSGRPCLVTFFR